MRDLIPGRRHKSPTVKPLHQQGCIAQGFEIHWSTGAPLPEKDYGWQKKLEEYFQKLSKKKIIGIKKKGIADFVS